MYVPLDFKQEGIFGIYPYPELLPGNMIQSVQNNGMVLSLHQIDLFFGQLGVSHLMDCFAPRVKCLVFFCVRAFSLKIMDKVRKIQGIFEQYIRREFNFSDLSLLSGMDICGLAFDDYF